MSIERVVWVAAVALIGALGCSDDVTKDADDANAVVDGGSTTDAAVTDDDGGSGPGPIDAEFDLTATLGEQTVAFERAYYGVTAPRNSNRDRWELYLEVYAGGVDGCPSENSPTPDQTLIIAGATFPDDATVTTDADGLAVSFLDFSGDITDAPVESARGERATVVSWEVCRECDSDPEGFVVLDLDAPFTIETATAEGEAVGRVVATHCPSLDAR